VFPGRRAMPRRGCGTGTGPVVIVDVSRHGSYALIIFPPGPDPDLAVLPMGLPGALMSTVTAKADILQTILSRARTTATDQQTKETDRDAMFELLAWCWKAITEPVLTALGHAHTPQKAIETWPRVWWCPTGPAAACRCTPQAATLGPPASTRKWAKPPLLPTA
jgi:hypothetical protein